MTENKRFVKGYCCGDTGLIDNEKEEWFVENINSISDLERNWNDVLDKLNEVADENGQLKQDLEEYCNFSLHDVLDKKNKEIERLQSTLAYRSNQLALMEQLIDDLGHEEMKRQMEEILND